jgi:hypothetical protein
MRTKQAERLHYFCINEGFVSDENTRYTGFISSATQQPWHQ